MGKQVNVGLDIVVRLEVSDEDAVILSGGHDGSAEAYEIDAAIAERLFHEAIRVAAVDNSKVIMSDGTINVLADDDPDSFDPLNPRPTDPGEVGYVDPSERFVAEFHPQAWVNDYAIEIDHQGPNEWDCTAEFLTLPEEYRERLIEEMGDDSEALDDSDLLKEDPAAPEWVREHNGPFDIFVRKG